MFFGAFLVSLYFLFMIHFWFFRWSAHAVRVSHFRCISLVYILYSVSCYLVNTSVFLDFFFRNDFAYT